MTISRGLQDIGLQLLTKERGVTAMYTIYNNSLVGRRVILTDLSTLASVVQDGSHAVTPFVIVRTDNEPDFVRVVKLKDVVIIGEVHSNGLS